LQVDITSILDILHTDKIKSVKFPIASLAFSQLSNPASVLVSVYMATSRQWAADIAQLCRH